MAEKMYFNRAQLESMVVGAREEYIIGGRGLGKSEGFDARVLLRNAMAMPGSTGALLAPSYRKLKAQSFPAIARALARWGYREGVHYYVGHCPPKAARFKPPLVPPKDYKNALQFFNGSLLHFVSFDRPMSTNSMSLDYVMGPEAKFLNYDKITQEVLPALRGNRTLFGACPWHGGQYFSTDMPTSAEGRWILGKQQLVDPHRILLIKLTYLAWQQARGCPSYGGQQQARTLYARLQRLRAGAVFVGMYSSLENLEVLGADWFHDQARNLPPAVFRASILNEPPSRARHAYYGALQEAKHVYYPPGTAAGELADYRAQGVQPDCRFDGDLIPGEPLRVAFDYNAAINTCVVGQLDARGPQPFLRVLASFFLKQPQGLQDLAGLVGTYYRYHDCRTLYYYYDHTAVARSAVTQYSFADVVIDTLRRQGWEALGVYIGKAPRHAEKYNYLSQALRGDGVAFLMPRFNGENCHVLLEAMRRTEVRLGPEGFMKDKRLEKLPDSAECPDKFKPHITDAFDTLLLGASLARRPAAGAAAAVFL